MAEAFASLDERNAWIAARLRAGDTQSEVAAALGLNQATVSKLATKLGATRGRRTVPLIDRLRRNVSYCADTGEFRYLRGRFKGGVAKARDGWNGYVRIRLGGKLIGAHRLAWLYHYGVLPEGDIDHINRDRADNRIANLRLSTPSQNIQNTNLRADNTSGFKGVSLTGKNWTASIRVSGRSRVIGTFKSKAEAAAAYDQAAREMFGHHACTNEDLGLMPRRLA